MSFVTFLHPNMSFAANSCYLCRVVRYFNFYNRCVISALSSSACSTEALWSFCRSSLQMPESLFPEMLLASPRCVSLALLAIARVREQQSRQLFFSLILLCHVPACQQQGERAPGASGWGSFGGHSFEREGLGWKRIAEEQVMGRC